MIELNRWQELEDRILIVRLTQKRIEAGLTQEDVAEAMGCPVEYVALFENTDDGDPYLSTIRRYAAVVGAIYVHRVERLDPEPTEHDPTEEGDTP